MPKIVKLHFVVQRLVDGRYAVDLWDNVTDEPMNDSDRYFPSREQALEWCEGYKPGRYRDRSMEIHD